MARKPVNVEKGKQGFQRTGRKAAVPPTAAPAVPGGTAVPVVDEAGSLFDRMWERLRGSDPLLDAALADYQSVLAEQNDAEAHRNLVRAETDATVAAWETLATRARNVREEVFAEAESVGSEAAAAAKNLYMAAGLSERQAAMFSGDIKDAALDRGIWHEEGAVRTLRPLRFKIKKHAGAALEEKTTAAAEAAKTDPDFLAAADKMKGLARRLAEEGAVSASAHRDYADASRRRSVAEGRLSAAVRATQVAAGAYANARARHAAGIPADAVETGLDFMSLRSAPEISRNPDGTTNVWVQCDPDDSHTERWFDRVVGVERADNGQSHCNVLVTASGDRVSRVEHWFRGPGNGWNRNPKVLVCPPAEGATPLAAEAIANAGWSMVVDTTD